LLSGKLGNARRALGIGLVALGALTTIPSLRFIRRSA
jgi:hypothetical protein